MRRQTDSSARSHPPPRPHRAGGARRAARPHPHRAPGPHTRPAPAAWPSRRCCSKAASPSRQKGRQTPPRTKRPPGRPDPGHPAGPAALPKATPRPSPEISPASDPRKGWGRQERGRASAGGGMAAIPGGWRGQARAAAPPAAPTMSSPRRAGRAGNRRAGGFYSRPAPAAVTRCVSACRAPASRERPVALRVGSGTRKV